MVSQCHPSDVLLTAPQSTYCGPVGVPHYRGVLITNGAWCMLYIDVIVLLVKQTIFFVFSITYISRQSSNYSNLTVAACMYPVQAVTSDAYGADWTLSTISQRRSTSSFIFIWSFRLAVVNNGSICEAQIKNCIR